MKHGLDWPEIKGELERRGVTLSDVADRLEVSPQAVSKVKKRPSRNVQRAIAEALNLRPEEIWPDRYSDRRAA